MARSFVGTNNIQILTEDGTIWSATNKTGICSQDIFIQDNFLCDKINFSCEEDDDILEYVEDDGNIVEPKYYMPIIPMVLVNGCNGIGVGWSSMIPNYSPLKIVEVIKEWISTGIIPDVSEMIPWVQRNSKGKIEKDTEKPDRFLCWGCV